jgi:hypothetical protein
LTSVGATPAHRLIKGSGAADRCRKGSCLHRQRSAQTKDEEGERGMKRKEMKGLPESSGKQEIDLQLKGERREPIVAKKPRVPKLGPNSLPALLATADNPLIPSQSSNNRQSTRKQRAQGLLGLFKSQAKGRALSRDALRLKEPRLQLGLSSRLAFERTNKHGRPR